MSVYEVPREDWRAFCERLTEWARGTAVTIEILPGPRTPAAVDDLATGAQIAAQRPLMGIDIAEDDRLVVAVHDPAQELEVAAPVRLEFAQHGEQEGSQLRADTSDGRTVLIGFEQALIPGIMDDLP